MTGDNDATGTILHVGSKSGGLAHGRKPDEGLGSKSGGLAHGRRLFERYGLHYMLLGVWQAKNVSAEKNRLADRRSGGATEGEAGRPPKGFAAKEGV